MNDMNDIGRRGNHVAENIDDMVVVVVVVVVVVMGVVALPLTDNLLANDLPLRSPRRGILHLAIEPVLLTTTHERSGVIVLDGFDVGGWNGAGSARGSQNPQNPHRHCVQGFVEDPLSAREWEVKRSTEGGIGTGQD
jgi:hypothetical protein